MASSEKHSSKNRLLAVLTPGEYRRLLPKFETVSLSLKQRVYESLKTIGYVYFPLNGVVSIVAFMNDGSCLCFRSGLGYFCFSQRYLLAKKR
jgi:hypothetical protein